MSIPRILCVLAALLATSPALAQRVETGSPPERESTLVVYGDDPCPQSSEEEIVICARRPEEERYRIPAPLRQTEPTEVAWGARVEDLENASRVGRPNSCSVVGVYGQGGCTQQMIRDWYAERRSRRSQP
ncbi:hypothetical protein RCO27_10900 [Sphingosinicella sp. LHD-64]|uniref:hypothetical protein n=1 Tax=Sphingosinicella sp. LHD-64 TaxID=3072139 RepID=UPI00280DAE40|nr:hypothetical protein [Sphingosinicella sp. LHD-64]MDQ8756736.1 hypothetical protein [Sphingosinicella sp. LHD-64]